MPHALLLSPDDQAVSAITGVLEEMSVTCERPLDGTSAAQKLNSASFDLVLVDCENLPAAKLIFDVCRRGKNGNNPVPIAIVDGRAGLPTAFRLGAELILTKPVAKDQARTTIRTAVGRVRKDVHPSASVPAQAVAAAAVSSQLTSFSEPAPSFVPSALPSAASNAAAAASTPAVSTKMKSAVDAVDASAASPSLKPQSASFAAPSFSAEPSSTLDAPVSPKPSHPIVPSDDPVLAELEQTELEESERAESQPAEAPNPKPSSGRDKTAPDKAVAESAAPMFSYQHGQQKPRGPLVALLVLAIASAGLYAAWTYEPGFRAIAQPQIDRVLALAGMAPPAATSPKPAKPSGQLAPATVPAPAPGDPSKTQSTAPDSGTATASAATSTVAGTPVQPSATSGTAVAPPASGATAAIAPAASKPETGKATDSKAGDIKKDAAAAPSSSSSLPLSSAPLPGENTAIILSSQGAQKRLAYSVAAKYPVEARSEGADGTVVLKAVVDENGKVGGLRLVEGNAMLATAAIQAVKQWRYRPYVRDGKPQAFQTVVIVDFQRP